MPGRFDSFILLADMRTGSNFLEETLNTLPDLHCWGEAFNPYFVGHARKTEMAGITIAEREAQPGVLLDAMAAQTAGLPGFRFFHDHDPRILDRCLPDPRCAKVILTRNPLDSFVSLQIARETGQWRLGDMKTARSATVEFDAAAFRSHLEAVQTFQQRLMRGLQTTGQSAFHIGYDDVGDLDVLNGLAAFLGIAGRLTQLSTGTKVQNPAPLRDKVVNYDAMVAALGDVDHFDLGRTPNFEPRRGPAVPAYIAAPDAPLLFLPLRGGPDAGVRAWLGSLGDAPLLTGMNQKDLRRWRQRHPGHRTFTVLRDPGARAHDAFCRHILIPGPECFGEMRETLRTRYKLPIPEGAPDADWDIDRHRAAFAGFMTFLKGNLGGQTSLRVDPSWASQSMLLQGMTQVALPDLILREDEAAEALAALATKLGLTAPALEKDTPCGPHDYAQVRDSATDAAILDVYQRDYQMFGFGPQAA